MGTLSDITARVTNSRNLPASTGYRKLKSPSEKDKENFGTSRSPHFMTPTISSSKQSAISSPKSNSRNTTPVYSKSIKDDGDSNGKMTVRRVRHGNNADDGKPRSSKEGHKLTQSKAISFPDKFATPSHGNVSYSPPSASSSKISPRDKPLPNPPVILVDTSSPKKESKTLIDASDRPLRRASPTGDPEEWPALRPRRPSSPGTLQEMMLDTGNKLKRQSVSGEKERYPLLGNTVRHIPSDDQLPISRFSAHFHTPPKDSPPVDVKQTKTGDDDVSGTQVKTIQESTPDDHDPFREGNYNKELTPSKKKSKVPVEPRQTRASSLRARLNAGQLDRSGQNKVVGFTDFTAQNDGNSDKSRKSSLEARKEARARRSMTPPNILNPKASKESLGGNRAPAQFVAGSRRTSHPRRPSSRGSLRGDAAAPAASGPPPPTRPAPPRPNSEGSVRNVANSGKSEADAWVRVRASSIPVPRHAAPVTPSKTEANVVENGATRNTRDDHSHNELPQNTANLSHDPHHLEAIEESPQHRYQLKRLSVQAPEYGPTLRISPSADRFIMGPDLGKDDHQSNNKESKENGRQSAKRDLKSRRSNPALSTTTKSSNRLPRPLSSQGLSKLGSRVGLVDPKVREKKAKSADLSLASPKMIVNDTENDHTEVLPASKFVQTQPVASNVSKASTSTTFSNDPFYDAQEEITETYAGEPGGDRSSNPIRSNIHKEDVDPFQDSNNIIVQDFAQTANEGKPKLPELHIPSTPQQQTSSQSQQQSSGGHPPRSSSRTLPAEWTSSEKESATSPLTASHIPPPTPPKMSTDSPPKLPPKSALRNSPPQVIFASTARPTSYRDSAAKESSRTQGSMPRSVLSNLKGLFHKRSSESSLDQSSTVKKKKVKTNPKATVQPNGSPYPEMSNIHPLHRPTQASLARAKASTPRPSTNTISTRLSNGSTTPRPTTSNPTTTTTPTLTSPYAPNPNEVSTSTAHVMQLLESARAERSSPKKERLLELGKILVDAITQAREAEKAMEEAKQAARKAEVANAMCVKAVGDVSRCVEAWRAQALGLGRGDAADGEGKEGGKF